MKSASISHEIIAALAEAAQSLPSTSAQGQFYVASLEYLHYGREPEFKMAAPVKALYSSAKPLFSLYRDLMADEA